MSWLRRLGVGDDEPRPAAAQDDDSPEALRAALADLVRFVNRSSGQLPAGAVVRVRRLTDTLGEVIETSSVRPLDVYAAITVRSTVSDYLPTTVRRFLAVPEGERERVHGTGLSPVASLLEQVEALQTSVGQGLTAARAQDTDALMTQGAFLRTKFSGSDLDL